MIGKFAALLCVAWVCAVAAKPAAAQELIADLSSHLIAITTMFTGGEVVLFGSAQGAGEVAVVVTGPRGPVTVRRKESVVGLWVNRKTVTFPQAPSFYAVAASAPLETLAARPALERHGLGPDHVKLDPARPLPIDQLKEFRAALIRTKQQAGLYVRETGDVQFLGGGLFRVDIRFPSDVPTGLYTVEAFLLRDGEVTAAQTTPLTVTKSGVSAEIYEFAMGQPTIYGVLAVSLAVAAGWLGALAFRRP